MLKYNGSNPSLLPLSVELDLQNSSVSLLPFYTVLVSFETEFDSNYHIHHNDKAD